MSAIVKVSIYIDGKLLSEMIGPVEQRMGERFTVLFMLDNKLGIEGWDWQPVLAYEPWDPPR